MKEKAMQIDHDAMVLVADGRKLLFFRNKGDRAFPQLEAEEVKTDFHELEEARFAAEAADLLKRRAFAQDYEKLIIVAPPTALGEMRKHYHKEVQDRLVGEIAKDLANHPVAEIEKIIARS
ncbi:hypothetical protein LTR94_012364 [Friedmanniomyces endolithicus]|nr:hypothetical protein LTR94_012364 [Friedmanniomyces endolithicus]